MFVSCVVCLFVFCIVLCVVVFDGFRMFAFCVCVGVRMSHVCCGCMCWWWWFVYHDFCVSLFKLRFFCLPIMFAFVRPYCGCLLIVSCWSYKLCVCCFCLLYESGACSFSVCECVCVVGVRWVLYVVCVFVCVLNCFCCCVSDWVVVFVVHVWVDGCCQLIVLLLCVCFCLLFDAWFLFPVSLLQLLFVDS